MLIYPAIDIRGGKCVRLRQGDYAQETVFGDDPAMMARRWVDCGATSLHLVDLDGAKQAMPVNGEAVRAIIDQCDVTCQLGGGLRTEGHIAEVLSWGVDRVILSTRALFDPLWFRGVCERFPNRVVLGIDAKHGRVAANGWLELSDRSPLEFAREAAAWPIAGIVYTDITRDGMLEGPNLSAYAELLSAVDTPILASGGITTLDNIRDLARLGVAGCVIGRALYEGQLDLKDVLAITTQSPGP
ncbi:MAG: 1-(5-phosphoribosyl)-5-[(5-phosphoribosylamino)methylideneamino]imidazole-4-carboxamide isomerase [Gemmataceae bacterium]